MMDALDELEQMDESARAEFAKIASASTAERAGLWAKLHASLKLHERIEEQFVYDQVVKDVGGTDARIDRYHEQHETEARAADEVMTRLGKLEPSDSQWLLELQGLQSMMEQHMAEEENQFWPLIRATWSEDKLQSAGRAVGAAKAAGTAGASIAEALGKAEQTIKGG
jgi:iron-sulfur cluster repair protein YtfE (RIC family)